MAELGGGIQMNENVFIGGYSGFGYAGTDIKIDDVKFEASSIALPLKAFASYNFIGLSAGMLISFNSAEAKSTSSYLSSDINIKEDKILTTLDFGVMVFPTKSFSINFDILPGDGVTGYALGVSYYFGRETKPVYYDHYYEDYGISCFDLIEDAYIGGMDYDVDICLRLSTGVSKCINLNEDPSFSDMSISDIRDFEMKDTHIYWKFNSIEIPYDDFFIDGCESNRKNSY